VDKVHDIIKNYVASGEIKKSRIDESFKRIMKLKKRISPDWEVKTLKTQNQKLVKLNEYLKKANEETQQLKSSKKTKKKKSKDKK